MKQTPIQKAIEEIEKLNYISRLAKKSVIEELKLLLPYEEETIKQAYVDGWNDRGNDDGDYSKHTDSDDYFNQTFKK